MKRTKLSALLVILVLVLNILVPYVKTSANTAFTVTFQVKEGEHEITKVDGRLLIDGQIVELRDSNNIAIGEVDVTDAANGSITVSDGTAGKLNYYHNNSFTLYNSDGHVAFDMDTELNSNIVLFIENYANQVPPPNPDPNPGSNFDGEAYFVWMSDNKVCYHKFTGLTGMKNDGTGYDMNYVNVNEITDESGNGGVYTWGQELANWVLATDMEDNHVIKENLTQQYIFGDGTDENKGVQLNPTNAKDGANSICSNGDMNFRVTIYRDNYQAIKFGTKVADYTYFPFFWDQTFFTSTVDLSGTSKENPAVYETYLLEPTISFEVGDNSKSNNITKVEALDVNPNAVTITKDNGKYIVKFNSNYYDNVVFAITTADGTVSYVMLARMTIRAGDNFGPDTKDTKAIAELYYPTTNNYSDFEMIATIVKKDGTFKTQKINVDNNANNDGGKGLYMCGYSVDVNQATDEGVYFTVLYKGALNGKKYGGTFSGSGKGVYYDIEKRTTIYNKK